MPGTIIIRNYAGGHPANFQDANRSLALLRIPSHTTVPVDIPNRPSTFYIYFGGVPVVFTAAGNNGNPWIQIHWYRGLPLTIWPDVQGRVLTLYRTLHPAGSTSG